jgi:uncharacterized protein involved in exopolysaccharide biosynthesis
MTTDQRAGNDAQSHAKKVFYVVQQPAEVDGDSQIDLIDVGRAVWRRKWWVAGFTALCTSLAVAYALLATQWYRAEATLMPRESRGGSGLVGQLAQFGDIAGLAGLGGLGQSAKQEPMGVLKSKGFARRFIEQNDLVEVIANEMTRTPRGGNSEQPDVREVVDRFTRSMLVITEDKKGDLVKVAVEWKDPSTAADWANKLAIQVNDEMRSRAQAEAGRNIDYLRGQLEQTETVSLQQAIARLLEAEMQKMMLAQGTDQYAFRIVDEAQPPVRRARPKRTLIVMLTFMSALLVSALAAAVIRPQGGSGTST